MPSEHVRAAIEQFVANYIKAGESDDSEKRNGYFASIVTEGKESKNYSREQIRKLDEEYCQKWPVRSYAPIEGSFAIRQATDANDLVYVTQRFKWTIQNSQRTLSGTSKLSLTIRYSEDGRMDIVQIDEERIN